MIKRLMQSNTAKFTSIVFVGNLLTQFVIFIAFALFSRYFSLEDLGVYTVFISLSTLFSVVAAGRYEMAIMLPKEQEKSIQILQTCLLIALSFCFVFFILIYLIPFGQWIHKFHKIQETVYLLPVGIFFLLANTATQQYYIKAAKLKHGVLAKFAQSIFMLLLSFALINSFNKVYLALIIAWVVSQLISFLILYLPLFKFHENFSLHKAKEIIAEYKRYPTVSLFSNFVNTFSIEIPNYFIPMFFGVGTQTLFAYGNRVAAMPRNLIANSVGDIFYKEGGNKFIENPKNLFPYAKKIAGSLFLASIIMYGFGVLVSDYLFPIVFDKSYIASVPYFKWISLASVFLFVQSPISTISDILAELKAPLAYNIISIVVKSAAFIFGGMYFANPVYCIALYAIVTALLSVSWIMYLLHISYRKTKEL